MRSEIKKIIEKELSRYKTKEIKISDKKYPLYIIPELCDEDLNIFEGFLFVEAENKSEVSYLKTRYKPPVSGYAPRLGIILYDGHLLIKDYRRNKHIIKTLKKINKTFLKKLKKALSEPKEENFNKLFDRSDVIEEFYILYKKTREYLLKPNNLKGISEQEKREEFVDNFMMQMLTLWYLQERGFFNNDKNYFITKFKELKQKKLFNGFKNYYEFLVYLFEKISGYADKQYIDDDPKIGKVVVIGPAVFLNGKHSKAISIPDKCFYQEGITEKLINIQPKKGKQKITENDITFDVPLLNLFESRDWVEGDIDEYVLGSLYEKLMTEDKRKKTGSYYTPEEITSYICKKTIEPYLVDRVNEKFNKNFETIDQIIESNDRDILLYLFEQLKEIKILDPAVGSAHFLESAINILVSIYEKIREKAKELNIKKGLEIIATDEKGKIKTINLLEISDDEFKLLVKFFIILSKNIYGVDINPSALKVAKARLFLTLAKHFKVGKEKDIFIRFPNVHFNLREGNSLIGYVEIGKEKETKQPTLFDFGIREEEIDYITEKIKVVEELKSYLEKTAKSLNLDGNIVEEVKELNKILAKRKIDWNDFEKVLRTKEKLITILIASLNSKYAKPLNDLLNEITDLFNQKLDEKFAEEHSIKLEDLKKIKTFHWIFEFPEVFLDRGGFDVVVGNPPYGNTLEDVEKEICKDYSSYTGEIASVFVERCIPMNKNMGYFSFIITYAITFNKDLSGTRKFIFENYEECFISTFDRDKCRFFDNMTQSVSIMLCKRKTQKKNCKFYTSQMFRVMPEINSIDYQLANSYLLGDKVGVSFQEKHRLPKIGQKTILDILGKIVNNKQTVSDLISNRGEKVWIRTSGNYWYNAWDRKPYQSSEVKHITVKKEFKDFLVLLVNSSTFYLWFRIYGDGRHMNIDIMKAFPIPFSEKIKSVSGIISFASKLLMNFLFFNFDEEHNRFNTSNVKPVIDICDVIIGKLYGLSPKEIDYILNFEDVIRGGKKIPDLFFSLIDYLLFASYLKKGDLIYHELTKFLIYELYFKEKFAKDGLYPEPKEYLLEAVSKHLKPINYDRWAELYWKKQIEGNLTEEEEEELEKLEKGNLETIQEVYKSIKQDIEIKELIEKIKSHEWVRVIEGGN